MAYPLISVLIQTIEVTSIKLSLSEQAAKFDRDVKRTESEKEVILDDLDGLNEQYQQLQEAFATQTRVLYEANGNAEKLASNLAEKEVELTRLYSQQRERRESFSKVSVLVNNCRSLALIHLRTNVSVLELPNNHY